MLYNVVCINGKYALIETTTEFIVVSGYDKDINKWEEKQCFSHWGMDKAKCLLKATDVFIAKIDDKWIPRSRLEELATLFKDGLMEDDYMAAKEYFEESCEMSKEEFDFFGISL